MAGGSKVREWLRRRVAPRRKAAAAGSGSGDSSHEASPQSSPQRKLREGASSSSAVLRRAKPAGARNALAALFQRAVYHLLWLVESVVVVARLVFFFVRFGFRF
ncbi:hypothetical protein ACP4OV_027451 [Aristida adscensionis]